MFEIEENIPIPKRRQYPFKKMKVGDSFFISEPSRIKPNNIQSCIMADARHHHKGKKFTTRQIKKSADEILGIRCWRME